MTTQEPTGGPVVRTGKKNGEEGRLPVEQAAAYLPARAALREALLVYTIVSLTCVLLALGARLVPQASEYFYLGFPALFLLVPTWLVTRRDESFDPYGLGVGPWRRGLLYFAGVSLLIFPLFVYGYLLFYRLVCGWAAAGYSVPRLYRALCPHFDGRWIGDRLTLSWGFAERAASQVVVVALPEEYFFRGYLQTRFEQVWPPRRRLLGGGVGWALVVSSLLFALGHVIIDLRPLRLAVFFPSLLFGWLRGATGSILAGVLFHASCNILIDLLNAAFFS